MVRCGMAAPAVGSADKAGFVRQCGADEVVTYSAMRVHAGQMSVMSGASGDSFLLPLLLGITLITFVLTLTISLSPTEAEIRDDAEFRSRLETLERHAD
jgi:hypothetical protein